MTRHLIFALPCLLAFLATPLRGQVEASAGVIIAPNPVSGSAIGPSVGATLPLPGPAGFLVVDVGAARTDFTTLGRSYHDDHLLVALQGQWSPIRGDTQFTVRVGVGAYGEFQTVETDPPRGGGDNGYETVAAALSLSRALASGTRIVLTLSDILLGPVNALADPEEYDLEHRLRIHVGLRF